MLFVDDNDVMVVIDGLVVSFVKKEFVFDIDLFFLWMMYDEVKIWFGYDVFDFCFGLEIVDCMDFVLQGDFGVFKNVVVVGGYVWVINVKNGQLYYSCCGIDVLMEFVKGFGVKGFVWFRVEDDGKLGGVIVKFFSDEFFVEFVEWLDVKMGDLILFLVDQWDVTCKVLYVLWIKIGAEMQFYDFKVMNFSWVVEFLMFEYDMEEK